MSTTSSVRNTARQAAFTPLMETLTRIGYAVRGLIYVVMGVLALQVALGQGGALANPQDAIAAIGRQPSGKLLLWIVLVGLISYALWGVIRAVYDPLHKGNSTKGLITRFGYLVSAFGYAVLAFPTYGYITGKPQPIGGAGASQFISSLMPMPWGRWAIGILGLIIIGDGLYQVYLGYKGRFDRPLRDYALNRQEVKVATDVGRFGTAARGVVFALVGGLITLAAYQANPNQPVGINTALATLMHQPYGVWLLGLVALGLVAFGAYSLLSAVLFRLRR